jgi:hypothetical protein
MLDGTCSLGGNSLENEMDADPTNTEGDGTAFTGTFNMFKPYCSKTNLGSKLCFRLEDGLCFRLSLRLKLHVGAFSLFDRTVAYMMVGGSGHVSRKSPSCPCLHFIVVYIVKPESIRPQHKMTVKWNTYSKTQNSRGNYPLHYVNPSFFYHPTIQGCKRSKLKSLAK